MDINGIAHIQLSVRNFEECVTFYRELLNAFGMRIQYDTDSIFYMIGARTGIALTRAESDEPYSQTRSGLHHFCFRAKNRESVESAFELAKKLNAKIIRPPGDGNWAQGYYSCLFEDPDGIRVEVNFVPGKGNLEDGLKTPLDPPKD